MITLSGGINQNSGIDSGLRRDFRRDGRHVVCPSELARRTGRKNVQKWLVAYRTRDISCADYAMSYPLSSFFVSSCLKFFFFFICSKSHFGNFFAQHILAYNELNMIYLFIVSKFYATLAHVLFN